LANSIQKDVFGPLWPLGLITVAASGTPVNLMSVVDPSLNIWNPATPTPGTSGAITENIPEYTVAAQQLLIWGVKSVGPYVANAGTVYILEKGAGGGSGNKTDPGSIIGIIQPGGSIVIGSAASNRNVFNPYLLYVDADNSNDSVLVTLVIQ
jgi:hypothetical protein